MIRYILIVSFLILPLFIFSKEEIISSPKDSVKQDSVYLIDKNIPDELIFIDFIGNLYGLTICYEKMFYKIDNYQRLYFHTGIGASWAWIAPDGIGIPLTVNYVLGKNYDFEIGIGILLYGKYINAETSNFNSDLVKFIGNISYRYHFKNNFGNSKIFKIGFSPIYEVNNSVLPNTHFSPSISISVGI